QALGAADRFFPAAEVGGGGAEQAEDAEAEATMRPEDRQHLLEPHIGGRGVILLLVDKPQRVNPAHPGAARARLPRSGGASAHRAARRRSASRRSAPPPPGHRRPPAPAGRWPCAGTAPDRRRGAPG